MWVLPSGTKKQTNSKWSTADTELSSGLTEDETFYLQRANGCVGITVTLNIYYYYYYYMYECFKLTSSPDEADMQDSVAISHVVCFWEELKSSGMVFF